MESVPKQSHVIPGLFGILEVLLYSNVFISVCAFFLTVETYLLAGLKVSLPMATFIFLAALFTYNVSSIMSVVRNPLQPVAREGQPWSQRNKKVLAVIGSLSLGGAIGIFLFYKLNINTWVILHLGLLSIGYTVPVIYKKKSIAPLRSVPLLKVFLITYVWAAVTAVLPLMEAGQGIWNESVLEVFFRRFLFIGALALLFDIRDYSYDKQKKTLTIPGLIGIANTKLLSLGLLLIYMLFTTSVAGGSLLFALILSAVFAGLVVAFSSENKPRLYYALLADGAMLLHAGLVYAVLH